MIFRWLPWPRSPARFQVLQVSVVLGRIKVLIGLDRLTMDRPGKNGQNYFYLQLFKKSKKKRCFRDNKMVDDLEDSQQRLA
jgi:hypothetical protein